MTDKLWYIYRLTTTTKINKILIHPTTWMSLPKSMPPFGLLTMTNPVWQVKEPVPHMLAPHSPRLTSFLPLLDVQAASLNVTLSFEEATYLTFLLISNFIIASIYRVRMSVFLLRLPKPFFLGVRHQVGSPFSLECGVFPLSHKMVSDDDNRDRA